MTTIRPVRRGEPYSRECPGGVKRTEAPSDGIAVELVDKDIFLSLDAVLAAIKQLKERKWK